ncbi:hypothetical protein [Streptomyces sp. NBC_01716]|uniref:hypothetical protein n=1 Tax=Streptomyces sp. NBC_01716 TaxID=2975917 RepID=UPI002E37FF6D|nr:hypothetical protein [Streptomyces sp. NBC_01716]
MTPDENEGDEYPVENTAERAVEARAGEDAARPATQPVAQPATQPVAQPAGRTADRAPSHPEQRPPTLLRVLLERLNWAKFAVFDVQFSLAARRAAKEYGNSRVGNVSVSRITFKRWLAGTQSPQGDAATVLAYMLGVEVDLLLQRVPSREVVPARLPHGSSLATARSMDALWSSSSLSPSEAAAGTGGLWYLDGLRIFDGTAVPAQMYEATSQDDVVSIAVEENPHLRAFVQPARRALLIASLGGSGGEGLFVLDSARARYQLDADPRGTLPIPKPYRLDDLTFGIVWAMLNLEDSLLADDHILDSERRELESHLAMPRSAVARSAVPELSRVGAAWLGSYFCALHIERHLGDVTEPPFFWTREQTGEEGAAWLFFRHKHEHLARAMARRTDTSQRPGHAFCIPERSVKESEPYERILLFLAVALMEMHGLAVWVCAEEEYSQIDEFVLAPDDRVIVANWLRSDGIWRVGITDQRSQVRTYTQAIDHARAHSVIDGPTSAHRLRALADYLAIDWPWLLRRCQELGAYGSSGMLRPRSRLLSMDQLDEVLRFVGELDPK